jgi:hypothetical protein
MPSLCLQALPLNRCTNSWWWSPTKAARTALQSTHATEQLMKAEGATHAAPMEEEGGGGHQGAPQQQRGEVQAASGGQAAVAGAGSAGESAAGAAAAEGEGEEEGEDYEEGPPSKRTRRDAPEDQPSSAEPSAFLSAFPAPGAVAPFAVDAALLGARVEGTVDAVSDSAYFITFTLGGQEFKGGQAYEPGPSPAVRSASYVRLTPAWRPNLFGLVSTLTTDPRLEGSEVVGLAFFGARGLSQTKPHTYGRAPGVAARVPDPPSTAPSLHTPFWCR